MCLLCVQPIICDVIASTLTPNSVSKDDNLSGIKERSSKFNLFIFSLNENLRANDLQAIALLSAS